MIFLASILLSGCGLFSGGKTDIDPPQNVSYEEDIDDVDGKKDDSEAKVQRELYLVDRDGYVVPRTIALPESENAEKQVLEYLIEGGKVSSILPKGFRAVLPKGTAVNVEVKDGIATVDFSKEFANYKAEDEMKIIQSVTWTLTQFDTVKQVKLKMNGEELKEMPVNGYPLQSELTRKIGINHDLKNVVDISNTKAVVVYYVRQTDDEHYYVPVTKRVKTDGNHLLTAIVEQLIKGPDLQTPLFSALMPDVALLNEPKLANKIVTLNFNENILGSFDRNLISDEVLQSIVLTLTEQEGIEGVSIQVNGKTDIENEKGEPITEPVTRPETVNSVEL